MKAIEIVIILVIVAILACVGQAVMNVTDYSQRDTPNWPMPQSVAEAESEGDSEPEYIQPHVWEASYWSSGNMKSKMFFPFWLAALHHRAHMADHFRGVPYAASERGYHAISTRYSPLRPEVSRNSSAAHSVKPHTSSSSSASRNRRYRFRRH